ncbi:MULTISPECIES: hypothetical protein [Exiguobacterium]|uniref:Uncharacterized protein n=1 Tax=Exiguobacterium marinum TaxID=273528 RepID=A0ABY7WY33_9BACL|nr:MULTISPECIES: hypothetical protein [Exiguobacterium]WDH75777.1 hypothetical protein PTI97_13220 [Exiguobacterium marinum]
MRHMIKGEWGGATRLIFGIKSIDARMRACYIYLELKILNSKSITLLNKLTTITVLLRASQSLQDLVKQEVASYGLNAIELTVLEFLYHKGEHLMQDIFPKHTEHMNAVFEGMHLSETIEQLK